MNERLKTSSLHCYYSSDCNQLSFQTAGVDLDSVMEMHFFWNSEVQDLIDDKVV